MIEVSMIGSCFETSSLRLPVNNHEMSAETSKQVDTFFVKSFHAHCHKFLALVLIS